MSAARGGLATLHPAHFAIVMATGIVSLAAALLEMPGIAWTLLGVNLAAYGVIWALTLTRAVRHWASFRADLTDHNRSVGFFTMVAGTCVLGNQAVVIAARPWIGAVLWGLGIGLWILFTYTILTGLTVKREKPNLGEGINGAWLLAVVAAQSVSVLGGLLAPHFSDARDLTLFFALVMWLGGGMLYIWIIALVFYRYTFFSLEPANLTPPYWINMGAMAISTLAGAVLIADARYSTLLTELLPFLKGLTLLFWSTATWWIPMLLILGVWRHVYRRFPLRYDVAYWGAVFPLGMYTVCTYRLSQAIEFPPLAAVARVAVYIALAAWTLTALGLAYDLATRARGAVGRQGPRPYNDPHGKRGAT
jgi:tellurite resistance protein TehA-like permease